LSFHQVSNVKDGIVRRSKNTGHRCRIIKAEVVWDLLTNILRDNDLGGKRRMRDENNPVSGIEALDIGTNATNDAHGVKNVLNQD
jgi:hypothetical protein